jgi:regulator of cell morphogenesis and NO signaling
MTINTSNTISELAISAPGAIRVFEEFGIDYCCGGSRSLEAACSNAGIPVNEIVKSIEEAGRDIENRNLETDWRSESMTLLIDHIVAAHHVYTREELVRIERLLDKVTTRHGANHPELTRLSLLFFQLKQELLPHMLKEEQILFPYLERLESAVQTAREVQPPFFATVLNPVRMMRNDHDAAGELLAQIREVTGNLTLPSDGCTTFEALYQALRDFERDLHQHIHLENNILFPKAISTEAMIKPAWQEESGKEHHCFGH